MAAEDHPLRVGVDHGRLLEGRVGIVTGAARGIGKAIASAAVEAGADLIVNDVLGDELGEAAASLRESGRSVVEAHGDISDVTIAASLPPLALSEFGRVDFVVNNAAAFRPAPFVSLSLDDLDAVFSVNFRGTFVLSQAAARLWVDRRDRGAIVNMSSVSASFAQPRMAAYGATKAAIERFSRNIALELAPHGIRVNCIAPGGPILSDYIRNVMSQGDRTEYATLRPPLGRLGDPDEVAQSAIFLVSDLASYITGTVLTVDGGLTLGRSYSTGSLSDGSPDGSAQRSGELI